MKNKSSLIKRENCPICNSDNIKNYLKSKSIKSGNEFLISTSFCEKCNFYFQNPIADYEKIKQIYENDYVGGEKAQVERFNREIIERKSSALSFIDLIKDGDSILEIGCSSGYNLKNILDNFSGNVSVTGIDFDKNSVAFGANQKGLNISNKSISEIGDKFNFVFLNHVFEHVVEPVEFFESLIRMLKEDGFLIINVPNSDVWMEAPYWEHVNYFSEKSLSTLAKKFFEIDQFTISTNTIHKTRHNVPEIRLICSKKGKVPRRKSEEYIFDIKYLRDRYDIATKDERQKLRLEYKKIKNNVSFFEKLFWSKLYILFTFKWIK